MGMEDRFYLVGQRFWKVQGDCLWLFVARRNYIPCTIDYDGWVPVVDE